MICELIGVGEALSQGGLLEANARLAAQELTACGVALEGKTAVGANVQALRAAIAKALGRSDIVLILGGLGPGADGITKETVCGGLGRRIVLHEDSLRRIQAAYEHAGRQMPQQMTKLAMLPEQSVVFPGVRGVTPGCALSAGSQFILLLPEDPREFVPMFQKSVVPYLAKFSEAAVVTRTVSALLPDSRAAQVTLGAMLQSKNPAVTFSARGGEAQIRVTATARTKAEASAICAPVVAEISKRFGEAVFGVDCGSLAAVAVEALRGAKLTVSAGEGGTDGLLARLLNAVPGSGPVLDFGISAPGDRTKTEGLNVSAKLLKKHGAASAQVAAAMAAGAKKAGNSPVGVAITGESAGKRGGVFYAALTDGKSVWLRELHLPKEADGEAVRRLASLTALNLLRLYAQAVPGVLEGGAPLEAALSGKAAAISAAPAAKTAPGGKKKSFFAKIFPVKGDPAAEVVRKLILLIAVGVFLASATYLANFKLQTILQTQKESGLAQAYNEALGIEDNGDETTPDGYPKGYQKKFVKLYEINPDVAGWLSIADTQVNYPVVHYTDNSYYLRRDFYRKDTKYGTPWLEANNSMEPQQDNYIIYAHNMTDGKMFGELMNYKGATGTKDFAKPETGLEYLKEHSIITFDDVYRNNSYKIVSVFITNAKAAYGDIFYYNDYLDLSDTQKFNTFVEEITARSYYTSKIDIKPGDKFLTLSTCSYEFGPVSDDAHVRTVVVARRVRDGEKANTKGADYAVNPNVKLPAGFTGNVKDAENAANHEQGGGLVPSAPAPTASAATQTGAVTPTTSSSKASSAAGAQAPESVRYDAEAAQISAQEGLAAVQTAADKAKAAATQAERAAKAADARSAANTAYDASVKAEDAYYQAYDALDTAKTLYQKYSSDTVVKGAYETAKTATQSAKKYWSNAKGYADAADSAAVKLEEAAVSSSSKPVSSSTPVSSSAPASSSAPVSSSAPASSSAPVSSSSKPEPVSEAPSAPSEPAQEENENEGASTVVEAAYVSNNDGANEKLTIVTNGKKTTGKAKDILPRVVMNEMGAGFAEEAVKAQAVAVYTFILQQNQSGIAPALGTKTPTAALKNVVEEVAGEAIYYKNKLAFTPFYATSAGVTVASSDVWGGSYPYLIPVESEIDENAKNYQVETTFTAEAVAQRVKRALGEDLYDYSSDPDDWFEIKSYIEGDRYVKKIRVGGQTITGRVLREQILGLRSAAFEIDYSSRTDKFTFTTYGYGHGVGMSQTGANLYASEEGWDYEEILTHYYPGTKVK